MPIQPTYRGVVGLELKADVDVLHYYFEPGKYLWYLSSLFINETYESVKGGSQHTVCKTGLWGDMILM